MRVLAGAAHSSILKVMAVLGIGRRALQPVACLPGRTAVDPAALEAALAEVPAGVTITYGEMAKRAGEAGAAQAAGVAVFPGRSGGVHAGRILQLARHRGAGGSSCSGRRKTTRFQVVGCLAWSRPGTGPRTGTPMP